MSGEFHRYQDEEGFIHACEGGYAATEGRSPYLVWTLCSMDVPACGSYKTSDDSVTCNSCVRWMEDKT